MYLVDANLLIYSVNRGSPHHARAREWLDGKLSGHPQSAGLPWPSLLAFLRLITNPRIFAAPADVPVAWKQVEEWLGRPAAWIPGPTPRHRYVLREILGTGHPAANLMPDAHLAALAVEHGLTVASADADFGRFAGVRWHNPIAR
jgi:toxin-antitoxin system PIN domain toxin